MMSFQNRVLKSKLEFKKRVKIMKKLNTNKTNRWTVLSLLALGASISFTAEGYSQESDKDVYKTYESCKALKEDAFRLKCFDTVLSGGVYSQQKIEQEKVNSFGTIDKPKAKEVKTNISVEIVKISKGTAGTLIYYLKNGQVWKQADVGKLLSQSLPFKAEIKKISLGGFRLSPVGSKRSIKVKRLR